jgi:hypothetical protein
LLCGTGILAVIAHIFYSRLKLKSCIIFNQPFMGGQDAHPTRKLILCGTGILPVLKNDARYQDFTNSESFSAGRMPTPQENSFFVEQASCLFLKMV